MDEGVDDLCERVPGWAGRAREVVPLDGGITNRNFRVTVAGEAGSFVVRSPGAKTDLLGIDRGHEREAAGQAATLGVGPEVVAFVEPEGSLVTRFVDGRTLSAADVAGPHLEDTARLLRQVHDAPPITGVFDWYEVPQAYAVTAAEHGVTIPAAYEESMVRAGEVRRAFAASPDPWVPCHNDLLPANFLAGPDGRLWLLDWEYAGMDDRFFDLGNLAVNNELDPDADARLLAAYLAPVPVTDRHRARLALMKVMSDLREAMWGVVQSGVSDLDEDFESYGATHFERLLANASTPQWDRLLEHAAGTIGG
jgi:thiamine kinase-like enzyme